MAVSIIWSSTNGGSAITEVDHSSSASGSETTEQEIFVRHDGVNGISNCGLYIVEKSGTYSGDNSAAADIAEILGWGDSDVAADFGGFEINMDKINAWAGGWPTYDEKSGGVSGSSFNTFRTGVGDSADNKILLHVNMGLSVSEGVLQSGDAPGVSFQCRIAVPSSVTTTGIRQFEQRLRYTYTS